MKNNIVLSMTLSLLVVTLSNIIIYMMYDKPLHVMTNITMFVLASVKLYSRLSARYT